MQVDCKSEKPALDRPGEFGISNTGHRTFWVFGGGQDHAPQPGPQQSAGDESCGDRQ